MSKEIEAHRKTWEARFEYWDNCVGNAERALEVAKNERYLALVELGNLAVKQMIEDGKL